MAKKGNTVAAISINTEILKRFKKKCIEHDITYSENIQDMMLSYCNCSDAQDRDMEQYIEKNK